MGGIVKRECACGCGGTIKGTAMKLFIYGHNPIATVSRELKPKSGSRARRIWLEEQLRKGLTK